MSQQGVEEAMEGRRLGGEVPGLSCQQPICRKGVWPQPFLVPKWVNFMSLWEPALSCLLVFTCDREMLRESLSGSAHPQPTGRPTHMRSAAASCSIEKTDAIRGEWAHLLQAYVLLYPSCPSPPPNLSLKDNNSKHLNSPYYVPGTTLNISYILTFSNNPLRQLPFYPHCADEETDSQMSCNLPKITELISGRDRIWTQSVGSQPLLDLLLRSHWVSGCHLSPLLRELTCTT